jgi:signal transduction histidine kinase/ligand-binding sensor domain-containing protein
MERSELGRGSRYVFRTRAISLLILLVCSRFAAAESDRTIAQFAHTSWGPKDGAPSAVKALAQSADGYLWLGSPDGLYRFDGVVFERYQPQSGGPFPAHSVISLLALPNGDLWIGFRSGGISLLRNGNVTNYTTRDGVPRGIVNCLVQDREGVIWAATDNGLARLEGNRWRRVGQDWNFPGKLVYTIFLDKQGTLWVSTEDTLVFLPSGARRFQATGIRVGQVPQIAQAANGKLWMAETTRSVRPIPFSADSKPADDTEIKVGSQAILFDNSGALWITSMGDGLRHSPAPESLKGKIKEFSDTVESFTVKDGLSDDLSRAILQDHEGNIWVGTNNGLDRFRKTNLVSVAFPFKLQRVVLGVGDGGDTWVISRAFPFIVRVHAGHADPVHPFPGQVLSAYRDPGGTVWWFCPDGILRYHAGNYSKLALPPSLQKSKTRLMMATQDGSAELWLAAQKNGLFFRKNGQWQELESASEFATLSPITAFTDGMGRAWFGYVNGTIICLKDENIQRVFSAADSLVGGLSAINGRGRHTWVGGEGGLAFLDGDRFQRIIPADAEAFGLVMGIEETPDGSLWLAESRGVIQVPAPEVRQALDNPSYHVKYRILDSFDGLSGTFTGSANFTKMIQGTDGRLWFATSGGIAWIDPAKISTNTLPPPVSVRSVTANGRQLDSLARLVLPPRTTDLQIGYTGLSLSVPERLRFRYRLEEVDKDWKDAGTRREAIYTRLGPGKYHFRVIACNNDGVWNETGASLDFSISPTWYQTSWFHALCVMAFLALLWALYKLRLRQLQRQFNIGLEARVKERTRIARELHDTLLQSFNALLLRLQTVSNVLPGQPGEAKQRIDRAIEQASNAVAEGRDKVNELRSIGSSVIDLDRAVADFARELVSGSDPASVPVIQVRVEGSPKPLDPIVRDEVYRIATEAMRNAFRHGQAKEIEVEIRYDQDHLRLRVGDNGTGIDPDVLQDQHKAGHWGLPGMRERARLVGGTLEIWSQANTGTEIELSIPASSVYTTTRGTRSSILSWF